jgi:hypothetical protein
VIRSRKMGNSYKILVVKSEGKRVLGGLRHRLKSVFKKQGGRVWTGSTWLRVGNQWQALVNMIVNFHKMREIAWPADQLFAKKNHLLWNSLTDALSFLGDCESRFCFNHTQRLHYKARGRHWQISSGWCLPPTFWRSDGRHNFYHTWQLTSI